MLKTLLVSNSCFSILCYLLLRPAILFVVVANTAVKVQFGFLTWTNRTNVYFFVTANYFEVTGEYFILDVAYEVNLISNP